MQTRRLFLKSHLSIHDVVPLFYEGEPSSPWYRTSSLWNCSLIPWCSSPFRDGDPPSQLTVPSILFFLQWIQRHSKVPWGIAQVQGKFCMQFFDTEPLSPFWCFSMPGFRASQSIMLFLHSMINTLSIYRTALNSMIQNPSSWCWSPVPDLPVHNAIPPFHGTEPPSSWYYSPNPWRCPAILW
jgi:hypothetical protein